jgi:hypothetical protein
MAKKTPTAQSAQEIESQDLTVVSDKGFRINQPVVAEFVPGVPVKLPRKLAEELINRGEVKRFSEEVIE